MHLCYMSTIKMNNTEIQNLIQDRREYLKVLFDYHQHSVNIFCEGYTLSQQHGRVRLAHSLRPDFAELHDGIVYYHVNSVLHSTEMSELLKAEPDYMFNMYLLLPDNLFSTFIYIQYEKEYFNFKTNRLYCAANIHDYLTDII